LKKIINIDLSPNYKQCSIALNIILWRAGMKKFILCSILLTMCMAIFSQTKGIVYKLTANIDGFTIANTRNNNMYIGSKGTMFKFEEIAQEEYKIVIIKAETVKDTVLAEFKTKLKDSGYTVVGISEDTYSIESKNLLPWMYKLDHGISHGPLSVPFRLRFSDAGASLAAGGSIGYYVGYTFSVWDLGITPLGSAGLSIIPIVDINSTKIETKAGIYGVLGLSVNVVQNVQVGIISGLDFIGGDWEYNWKPWISFGIGYSFTN
jgi:hypothetical protein